MIKRPNSYIISLVEAKLNPRGKARERLVWSLELRHKEELAGMLATGMGILEDVNYDAKDFYYYLTSNTDVSYYRVEKNILVNNIGSFSNRLESNKYGLWLKADIRFYYSLYRFETNYFMQGVIGICNYFHVDFLDYMYGIPFDGDGNQYILQGYNINTSQVAQDAPDLDDIDEDEAFDDTIINPLQSTDDVITLKS